MSNELVAKTTSMLSAMESLGMTAVTIEKTASVYLPYAFVNMKEAGDKYKLFIVDDGQKQVVNNPYILIPMTTRHMFRKLEGQSYTTRIYSTGAKSAIYGQVAAMSPEEMKANAWQEGYCFVMALIIDNVCKVVKMESCGGSKSYWLAPMATCDITKGIVVKISDVSHEKNVKTTKRGGYLCSHKFKGFETITLTQAQLKLVAKALEDQKDQIRSFMSE